MILCSFHRVLVRQSTWPEKSLSTFFYAKQFSAQQLWYEKFRMNKLPCKDLGRSLFFLLSLPLSLTFSLFLILKTKITSRFWSFWAINFSHFSDFGKVQVGHFTTFIDLGQIIIFNFNTLGKSLRLFTIEFNNKKYVKVASWKTYF